MRSSRLRCAPLSRPWPVTLPRGEGSGPSCPGARRDPAAGSAYGPSGTPGSGRIGRPMSRRGRPQAAAWPASAVSSSWATRSTTARSEKAPYASWTGLPPVTTSVGAPWVLPGTRFHSGRVLAVPSRRGRGRGARTPGPPPTALSRPVSPGRWSPTVRPRIPSAPHSRAKPASPFKVSSNAEPAAWGGPIAVCGAISMALLFPGLAVRLAGRRGLVRVLPATLP